MAAYEPIVAVEIGSTRVRALVGEIREDGNLLITGIGDQPSRGVRKAEIIHFDHALSSVKAALDEAESQSRVDLNEIYICLSGADLRAMINRGSIPITRPGQEISEDDLEHVVDTAKAVSIDGEREILHTIQQHFYVNDQDGVVNPAGMLGSRLAVDVLILHGIRNRLQTTVKVARSAKVEIADVAFSGLCSALAVLTPEQKESGVMVIDLGGGTTDYFVYADKAVALAGSFAVGGDHITNDLALGLNIPNLQAEQLKVRHGSAMVDLSLRKQAVSLPPEGGFAGRMVNHVDLQHIVHARADELFNMIREKLDEHDLAHVLGAGVVLTGGGAHLKKICELGRKKFGVRCFVGKPRNLAGLATTSEGPEFASVVGMLRYAMQSGHRLQPVNPLASWIKGFFSK